MRLLVVEDDEIMLELFDEALDPDHVVTTVARSRDSAFRCVDSSSYDCAVCDLRIPTTDGALDHDVVHGMAVVARLRERLQGTPVIVFSAFGTLEMVRDLVEAAPHEDFLGQRKPAPLLRFWKKEEADSCLQMLSDFADGFERLDNIEIATGLEAVDLDENQRRAMQLYAAALDGALVRVAELTGGLTETRTLRIKVDRVDGAVLASAIAKIGAIPLVGDEEARYQTHILAALPAGSYTPLTGSVHGGAGPIGGLFYRLADGFETSLGNLLESDPDKAAQVVAKLKSQTACWREKAPTVSLQLRDLRKLLADDEVAANAAAKIAGVDFDSLEKRSVQVHKCAEHGDLHGLNVLVNAEGEPIMIDFGRSGFAPACLDPMTLELSTLFHPKIAAFAKGWPATPQAEEWSDLTEYLKGCPFPSYIRACREWTLEDAAGDREIYAVLYSYSLRQTQYPGVNQPLATALLRHGASKLA